MNRTVLFVHIIITSGLFFRFIFFATHLYNMKIKVCAVVSFLILFVSAGFAKEKPNNKNSAEKSAAARMISDAISHLEFSAYYVSAFPFGDMTNYSRSSARAGAGISISRLKVLTASSGVIDDVYYDFLARDALSVRKAFVKTKYLTVFLDTGARFSYQQEQTRHFFSAGPKIGFVFNFMPDAVKKMKYPPPPLKIFTKPGFSTFTLTAALFLTSCRNMLYDLENAIGTKTETVNSLKMTCVLEEEITFPTDCNIETHNYDNSSTSNLKGTPLVPYRINYIEMTYALWYEVYKWALDRGYSFENPGREGSNKTGAPTAGKYKR